MKLKYCISEWYDDEEGRRTKSLEIFEDKGRKCNDCGCAAVDVPEIGVTTGCYLRFKDNPNNGWIICQSGVEDIIMHLEQWQVVNKLQAMILTGIDPEQAYYDVLRLKKDRLGDV